MTLTHPFTIKDSWCPKKTRHQLPVSKQLIMNLYLLPNTSRRIGRSLARIRCSPLTTNKLSHYIAVKWSPSIPKEEISLETKSLIHWLARPKLRKILMIRWITLRWTILTAKQPSKVLLVKTVASHRTCCTNNIPWTVKYPTSRRFPRSTIDSASSVWSSRMHSAQNSRKWGISLISNSYKSTLWPNRKGKSATRKTTWASWWIAVLRPKLQTMRP